MLSFDMDLTKSLKHKIFKNENQKITWTTEKQKNVNENQFIKFSDENCNTRKYAVYKIFLNPRREPNVCVETKTTFE
jgi:Zn/Cd-binding protein ZinT